MTARPLMCNGTPAALEARSVGGDDKASVHVSHVGDVLHTKARLGFVEKDDAALARKETVVARIALPRMRVDERRPPRRC